MTTATINPHIQSLRKEIVKAYGLDVWNDAKGMVSPSDWGRDDHSSWWVELAGSGLGDLEPHPHLVFCTQSHERGCIPNRDYRPIT